MSAQQSSRSSQDTLLDDTARLMAEVEATLNTKTSDYMSPDAKAGGAAAAVAGLKARKCKSMGCDSPYYLVQTNGRCTLCNERKNPKADDLDASHFAASYC